MMMLAKFENTEQKNIEKTRHDIRAVLVSEWTSTKLVEYESLRLSNGRVGSKMVKCKSNMRVYLYM